MLVLTCGCRQIFGLDAPTPLRADGSQVMDASGDGADRVSDAAPPLCFGREFLGLSACLANPPIAALVVPVSTSIDTDSFSLCAPLLTSSQDLCVVAAQSIMIASGAVIRVTGSRPLVLFSPTSIEIAGTLDVASHLGAPASSGPAENPMVCGATQAGAVQGGGAGGSFGTAGGDGGRGVAQNSLPGQARPAFTTNSFHGGCRGGLGANADLNVGAAYGGGALAMFADTVKVTGTINASGMAGHGGAAGSSGGNGGATGGMIVVSAPMITVQYPGQVFAVGGGGGGGASNAAAGLDGNEAASYSGGVPGGQGGNNAGDGGNAFPFVDSGQPGSGLNGAGGGGGGGGVGEIMLFTSSTFLGSRIAPTPQLQSY